MVTFTIPTPPSPSTGSASLYAPQLVTGPTGKDPYAAWIDASVDGVPCYANGVDQPWWWDGGANFFDMGSTVPTDFALALSAAGAPAAIPTGRIARYYLVRARTSLGKETAPQLAVGGDAFFPVGAYGVSISNASGGTRDVTVTWTPDVGGQFDVRRIYRALDGTDTYVLVAEVAEAAGTYLDVSPDATILLNTAYVFTYRTTALPKLAGLFAAGNRLWGFTGSDPSVYYFQIARTDARFVADDLPPGNQLPLEPNDGCGAVRAGFLHNGFKYALKERASYQIDGDDASSFVVTQMYSGRGCLGPRCIVAVNEVFVVLDAVGIYGWMPGGEPVVLGGGTGTALTRISVSWSQRQGVSLIAPIWKRMNLGAADTFFVVHDPEKHQIHFHIALDYEPVPNYVVVYDYRRDAFVLDPCVWRTAGGYVLDAAGELHRLGMSDLGELLEEAAGAADGVYAGSLTATITAGGVLSWAAAGAAFDTTDTAGCFGTLVERYDANLTIVDQNRVAAVTATSIQPLYAAAAPGTETLAVGVIPAVAQGGKITLGSDMLKYVSWATVEHEVEASSSFTLNFMSAPDNLALARPPVLDKIDLSLNKGRSPVSISDRGATWTWQISQRAAGVGFTVRALTAHYNIMGTPR